MGKHAETPILKRAGKALDHQIDAVQTLATDRTHNLLKAFRRQVRRNPVKVLGGALLAGMLLGGLLGRRKPGRI
jgi:ElaB/YqjD/DUF883 family membrane-anchored ribosome-binding protein